MELRPDLDGLVRRNTHLNAGGEDTELRRARRHGKLVRVTRGVYRPVEPDESTRDPDFDETYRELVVAVAGRTTQRVVSHSSAAALHGLNQHSPDQRRVHFYVKSGGRRGRDVFLHEAALTVSDVTVVDGVLLTKLALTACDIARQGNFAQAVVVLDHALRLGVTRAELRSIATRFAGTKGVGNLRQALDVADANSESVGESVSRALMIEWCEIPAPVLQAEYRDEHGKLIARVDFDWDGKVIGEFDGKVKYQRNRRPGESASDVVIREKVREDRLRDEGLTVVRWVWDDFKRPQVLRTRIRKALAQAGVI